MRKTVIAALAISLAIAALGTATRLDGLGAIGVIAVMIANLAIRLKAKDRTETRFAALVLGLAFVLDAVIGHRNPDAPLAVVLGLRTWTLALAAAVCSLLDAAGLTDWLDARSVQMQARHPAPRRS